MEVLLKQILNFGSENIFESQQMVKYFFKLIF